MRPEDVLPLLAWAPLTAREAMLLGVVVIAVLCGSLLRRLP